MKTINNRKYHYHFQFRVGGKKRGYDCNVEVKASSQKGAAQKIRNRIKSMPDVANVPDFHFSEVKRGLPVLASEGHTKATFAKFKRPGKIAA